MYTSKAMFEENSGHISSHKSKANSKAMIVVSCAEYRYNF